MKFIFLITFNFLFLSAQENPTFLFLRNDISARATAMGGSFTSMKNDPNGIFYNPAILSTIDKNNISLGIGNSFLDATSGNFAANYFLENFGLIGFGVLYQNYGEMQEIDENENIIGSFTPSDFQFILSTAKNIYDNLSIGISTKIITSKISSFQSTALALDGGLIYSIDGPNPISLGLSVLHLGKQIKKYSEIDEPLPLDVKAGFTIKPEHLPLLLNVNLHKINVYENNFGNRLKNFSIGGEFSLNKNLKFRFGYNNQKRKDLKLGTKSGMAGFSFGGGIFIKNYLIDYSYSSLGLLKSINKISISTDF